MNKKSKTLKIKTDKLLLEDCEFAFWDEFYLKEEKGRQRITMEELEDVTNLIVESKIPHLKTN